MVLGIIVVEDVFLGFYLALLQPILGERDRTAEIVLIGLFALARWGARLVRAVMSAGDAEVTTTCSSASGVRRGVR